MGRKIILFLLVLIPLASQARRAKETTMTLRDSIITEATRHIGKRYQYAGKGPNRFDCSGFTGYVFRQFGYELYASSASQYLQGEKRKLEHAEKGDLIFFKGSNSKSKGVGHVGIIYDVNRDGKNTTVQFIHASINKGITIDSYPESDYYRIRFIGIKRIIGESDRKEVDPSDEEDDRNEHEEEVTPPNKQEDIVPEPDEKREVLPHEELTDREEQPYELTTDTLRHIVKKKETLFTISRKHGCTVNELMAWNGLKNSYLKIGQTLYIIRTSNQPKGDEEEPKIVPDGKGKKKEKEVTPPQKKEEKRPDEKEMEPTVIVSDTIQHTIQPKETLYQLSRKYGCSVEDIKHWNHLKGNTLKIGQVLIILQSKQ